MFLLCLHVAMATAERIDAFYDKYKAILMAESLAQGSGCRLVGPSLGRRRQQGGYPVIKVTFPGESGRTTMTVARLMYICHVRCFELGDQDISHLCHNRDCISIDHLVLEARWINNSRQICNNQKQCTEVHQPFCIFPS